jgi:hypothetical protein
MSLPKRPFYGEALPTMLAYMQRHGSSVVLNYGEDTGLWECSWITGGDRFTSVCETPTRAAREVIDKVEIEMYYGRREDEDSFGPDSATEQLERGPR